LPFGFGKSLPAGLLREPLNGLKRAHAFVITRCDQAGEANLAEIEERLRVLNPQALVGRATHAVVSIGTVGKKQIALEELRGKSVFAFCGIGNPDAFLQTIQGLEINLAGHRFFNDHHHYTNECLTDIFEEARYLQAEVVLTTQKDWTKTALSA
jgi:tetraacyldisaccharide 4'-kinase